MVISRVMSKRIGDRCPLLALSYVDTRRGSNGPSRQRTCYFKTLLNHLVRPQQQGLRNRQPQRLGRFEINDQFELRRLLDRQIARFRALYDTVHVCRRATEEIVVARRVRQESASLRMLRVGVHRRQSSPQRERGELVALPDE